MNEKHIPLVSIIMPAYQCEKYIEEAIQSVMQQTYTNWELLVTEDHSHDNTWRILRQLASRDIRIRLFRTPCNQGAAMARNLSLTHASGRYIAYLDADDAWKPDKLEKQIYFMQSSNIAMCYAGIETVNENGGHLNYVKVPTTIDYNAFLSNTLTASSVMVIDTQKIDVTLLTMRKMPREDLCTWLQILKTGIEAKGINEPLAIYRKHENSSSANLLKMAGQTWSVYREVERLPLTKAIYHFVGYVWHAMKKRMKD